MTKYIILFLKGMGLGIANVIPGVSGGTIALITNIYEELINSLKTFDLKALKLLFSFNISEFIKYTNLYFLLSVFLGSILSVFTIAWIFDYLFTHYPKFIWGFFFGLILASIYFVGKRINSWNKNTIISLLIGTTTAFTLSFLSFSNENSDPLYVFICGVIGVSGMLLPGLSGSYILLIMGNYKLLMVDAIRNLDYDLLGIFLIGSVFGLMIFSHILAFLLEKFKDITLATLTGFIIGSLLMIWPWSTRSEKVDKPIIEYLYTPIINTETFITILCILFAIILVILLERISIKA